MLSIIVIKDRKPKNNIWLLTLIHCNTFLYMIYQARIKLRKAYLKSILSVDARQHLLSLIPEICVRNELDQVSSKLPGHKSCHDNKIVECYDMREEENDLDFRIFSTMFRNRYLLEFVKYIYPFMTILFLLLFILELD